MTAMTDAASSHAADDGEGDICTVKVYVRIRPLNAMEKKEGQTIEWELWPREPALPTAIVEYTQNGQRQYAYDACFGVVSTNAETYEKVGKPVVLKAMEGFNGTVFTYGQTGSGKTWTMRGCDTDPGMMILCIKDIFAFISTHTDKHRYTLKVSYMEVYNEEINDLLNNDEQTNRNLKITSEDAARGAVIGNLQEEPVETPDEFMAVLKRGEKNRSYASTSMNDNSSRSHVIYRVAITIFDIDDDISEGGGGGNEVIRKDISEDLGRVSYMNLVDLAGSERQKSTKTTGVTLKEGANINKSLLALGAVINKLGEASKMKKGQKPVFIPYRDSKLTRILKQSLGGNTLTSILCAISPAPMFREETVSTLKFGQLCKLIKNQVQSNIVYDDKAEIKKLRAIISDQKAKLEEFESLGGGGGSEQYRGELQRALIGKRRLEKKVQHMEAFVEELKKIAKDNGGDISSVQSMQHLEAMDDGDYPVEDNDEVHALQEKIRRLEGKLKINEDFEKEKEDLAHFEKEKEELAQRQEDIDKEKEKIENEKEKNAKEKEDNMNKLQDIEAREEVIRNFEAKTDALNSQLRRQQGKLNEQVEKWESSIKELKDKEDKVKEWDRDHGDKERTLNKVREDLQKNHEKLLCAQEDLADRKKEHTQAVKGLEERERDLKVALHKIYQKDSDRASAEKRLQQLEAQLKKREEACDLHDIDMKSSRRDHEKMIEDAMERDKVMTSRQRANDEKESALREKEEKIKQIKGQLEKHQLDVQKIEKNASDKQVELEIRFELLQLHEQDFLAKLAQLDEKNAQIIFKEENVALQATKLMELQARMTGIDDKERTLNEKIEDQKLTEERYYCEIAQISSKHRQELGTLEAKIKHQLLIMANFQHDLDRSRAELAEKTAKNKELEKQLRQRDTKEEQLIAELKEKESRIGVSFPTDASISNDEDAPSMRIKETMHRTPNFRKADSDDEVDLSDGQDTQGLAGPKRQFLFPQFKGSHDLIKRLADSQRALHHILESHNASQLVGLEVEL